jgi:hypothetical protein
MCPRKSTLSYRWGISGILLACHWPSQIPAFYQTFEFATFGLRQDARNGKKRPKMV